LRIALQEERHGEHFHNMIADVALGSTATGSNKRPAVAADRIVHRLWRHTDDGGNKASGMHNILQYEDIICAFLTQYQ
jgi:hypothetical protein